MRTTLERLFPDEDYRFHLRMERGDPADFFAPTALHEQWIAERQSLLRSDPHMYAALLPPGEPLMAEVSELAQSWNGLVFEGFRGQAALPQGPHPAVHRENVTDSELPRVLFFANPMRSDNDVIRRPDPEVLMDSKRRRIRRDPFHSQYLSELPGIW